MAAFSILVNTWKMYHNGAPCLFTKSWIVNGLTKPQRTLRKHYIFSAIPLPLMLQYLIWANRTTSNSILAFIAPRCEPLSTIVREALSSPSSVKTLTVFVPFSVQAFICILTQRMDWTNAKEINYIREHQWFLILRKNWNPSRNSRGNLPCIILGWASISLISFVRVKVRTKHPRRDKYKQEQTKTLLFVIHSFNLLTMIG